MRCLAVLALSFASALAAFPAVAASRPSDYAKVAEQEARLAAVSYRLTTAGAGWCPVTAPQPGWLLNDPRRFDAGAWPAAKLFYGVEGDGPFITAIAPNSPAARAGLRRGMRIVAINGEISPDLGDAPPIRIDVIGEQLLNADPKAAFTVTDGHGQTYRLDPAPGCASSFRLEDEGRPAVANGKLVRVRYSLAQSIADDDALAAVVAHELAHNILRHRARIAEASARQGSGSDRPARLVRQTELEADRLSVWLMADAGYDPAAAIRFWQEHDGPLIRAATHPPRKQRIAAIRAEMAVMAAARAADPGAPPPLVTSPPLLE